MGVQIYVWNGSTWVFQAPEAVLFADNGASVVILSGEPSNISFSRNLFYPGNPSGGVIVGDWFVELIPEPSTLTVILRAGFVCGRLWLRLASPDSSLPLPVFRSGKV